MAHTETPLRFENQLCETHSKQKKSENLFTIPFTEHDVLRLQAIFVTPGVHIIKVKNIHEGRMIIQTILQSLNYYHNIGCVAEYDVPTDIYDVVGHIKFQKEPRGNLLLDLEDFFAVHPCFDFIWVEFSKKFFQDYSLDDIKKIFYMYHAQERMPVLLVTYEN